MAIPRLATGDVGNDVASLHEQLKLHGLEVSAEEQQRKFFGPSTREAVSAFQKTHGIDSSGEVRENTATHLAAQPATPQSAIATVSPIATGAVLGEIATSPSAPSVSTVAGPAPAPLPEIEQHRVDGQIFFDHGLPAQGITVRVYSRGFGGLDKQLGEIKTDAQGSYALSYDPGGATANLEVRVVDTQGKEIPLSATKFNADRQEVMNLVAPSSIQPFTPEYQRLTADLTTHLGDLAKLATAQESAERPDLTLLNQATGWDARLIGLAAAASQRSADTGIPHDALYALFRTGLPTDKQQLAFVSLGAVEKALGKAKEAGIVNLSDDQTASAKKAFQSFARSTRLEAKAPTTLSSFGELLNKSALSDTEKANFADLYFLHRGTDVELWQKAREKGISEEKINGLRLQGKLAYITLNNAGLVQTLQQEIGSPDNLAQLVQKDLYRADAWKTRLSADSIPPAYEGGTSADRLDAYAGDIARKVRLSFPTQVVGRMIEKDELHLGAEHDTVKSHVGMFLNKAGALKFDLGRVPMNKFVRDRRIDLFPSGTPEEVVTTTIKTVKKLCRWFQITTTNESLQVISRLGFNSADEIASFPAEVFLDRFTKEFPSREEAQFVYRKAQQVSAVTHNLLTIARQLDSAPAIHAISPPMADREAAKKRLIEQFPTMESLFGSLDFCECEHCHSVLSPAAYLVDLLQFLDPEESMWSSFLNDWKNKHNDKAYDGPEYKFKKPYDALVERRPDLPHLPLTCENTETALPYIDVVNEILEYYVANDKLGEDAVRDTGEVTTPELLAEPQNVLPQAYDTLKNARYPLALPFDLWIETVRQFFDHFDTSLWQVLEIFRPSDDLFPPPSSPKPYYRAAIFAEYIGIPPAEYAIFTDATPLAKWFELYGYKTEAEALSVAVDGANQRLDLNSAKALSRRLGISYKELVDLVRTWFVNPALDSLVVLRKLRLDAAQVFRYKKHPNYQSFTSDEQAAFEKRLDDLTKTFNPSADPSGFNATTWLNTAWQNGDFNRILILADPDAGCNFDLTTLRYADGNPAENLVFLKINLFIRLRKRLGWTIDETDRALRAFLPSSTKPLTPSNLGAAFTSVLLYVAHLKALDERVNVGKNSRVKLLTLWSNLPTTGKNSLYSQLFLTRSILQNDPVFDDPLANYLSKPGILVKDHLLALQGALNLTANEVARILVDAGKSLDSAELSLDNVSLIYRYGLLAKALKLSLNDLLAAKELSGQDPFTPLSSSPVNSLIDDHPLEQTLRFVEVVGKIKESGFKVEDLNYLLRHRFDPVGKYRTDPNGLILLVKMLVSELRRIRDENAVGTDPDTLTDDVVRQKLALILPPDAVETFLQMWNGSVVYKAKQNAQPGNRLNPTAFAQQPAVQLTYDEVRQEQHLAFTGVMLDTKRQELTAISSSSVLAALLDEVQAQEQAFFETYMIGFSTKSDFDQLFIPLPDGATDSQTRAWIRQKRTKLAQAFLPFLQQKLTRRVIVQILTTSLNADPGLTEALITDSLLLVDPSRTSEPLLEAFAAAEQPGVSVTFFGSTDGTGAPLGAKTISAVDTAGKPAGTNSARFEGYVEVWTGGVYRFFAVFGKKAGGAELRFAHLSDPLFRGEAGSDGAEISQFIELKAGLPYKFTFDVWNLDDGDAALLVQGENLPKDSLARLALYPQSSTERVYRAQVLLAKTFQVIRGFGLGERELRHLLTHATDFENLNLSKLPTREADDSPAGATALFGQFLRLADYARLKQDIADGTDELIGIFENARHTYPSSANTIEAKAALLEDLCQRLANITRREAATVRSTAQALGFSPQSASSGGELRVETSDFTQEKGISRLWQALHLVEKLGIPVEALVRWSTPTPDFLIARDLKDTVKARYEPEDWRRIAQPIFDKLRQRQRDALVAHIMHRHDFERIEQLFEYFLIDPGMEPVVQTSRLRLAISCVQLFIQRCLLNLEPEVHPSAIDSKHWQWMKRYRVWEANRKIFLYPENWLEPEFRDDKTHLFQELESALLQGDISNDLVEDAFFRYLKKLEELARLEIVTMYCEEKPLDPASNTLHVIGRTFSIPHKYFYRRYAHQMWTPWEPVSAQIEGDHLVAVIWRDRLHLFWVTFLEKSDQPSDGGGSGTGQGKELATMHFDELHAAVQKIAPQKKVEVQLNWSEYFQGQWTTRESSGFGNPISVIVPSNFNSREAFISVSKEYDFGEERAVKVHAGGAINQAFRVVSKNSKPEVVSRETPQASPYPTSSVDATRYIGSGSLQVTSIAKVKIGDGLPQATLTNKEIIRAIHEKGEFSLLLCPNPATTIDAIKELAAGAASYLTIFGDPAATKTAIEGLVSFVESLPLRFSNSSASDRAAAFDEWSVITSNIWRLSNNIRYPDPRLQLQFWPIVTALISGLVNLVDSLLRRFSDPATATAADEEARAEIKSLVGPLFYQDNENAFFVEPALSETTIDVWEKWAIPTPLPDPNWESDEWWKKIQINRMEPTAKLRLPIEGVDPLSRFKIQPKEDWVTHPGTVLQFGERLVGPVGGLDPLVLPAAIGMGKLSTSANVAPGGELLAGSTIAPSVGQVSFGSLPRVGVGLNVIGSGGLNSVLLESLNARRGLSLIRGVPSSAPPGGLLNR